VFEYIKKCIEKNKKNLRKEPL
jgi:hypothetical protein